MDVKKETKLDVSAQMEQEIQYFDTCGTRQLIAGFVISLAMFAGLWIV